MKYQNIKQTIRKEKLTYFFYLTDYLLALGSILFVFLYKIELFSNIINLFK